MTEIRFYPLKKDTLYEFLKIEEEQKKRVSRPDFLTEATLIPQVFKILQLNFIRFSRTLHFNEPFCFEQIIHADAMLRLWCWWCKCWGDQTAAAL